MAEANKTSSEEQQEELENSTDKSNQDPKTYEESYVKELIAERDRAKQKARQLEEDKTEAEKAKEEELLKAKGDYETLSKNKEDEANKAVVSAKKYISNSFLVTLGAKHGIIDPDAVHLFAPEFEFDDEFNITNADKIAEQFEKEFVEKKPYLFKTEEQKTVPQTDNQPYKKPNASSSSQDGKAGAIPLQEILRERMSKK